MKNKLLKIACVAAAVAAFAGSAYANPEITLYVDGSSVDSLSNPVNYDTVSVYNDTTGTGWTINHAIGTVLDANTVTPQLDLASLDVATTSAGTLYIEFLYSGVGPLEGYVNTPSGSVTGDVTYSFSVISSGSGPDSSIGILATLVSTGHGSASIDDTLTVPDGGLTVGLLGLALAGVEGLRRKLRK